MSASPLAWLGEEKRGGNLSLLPVVISLSSSDSALSSTLGELATAGQKLAGSRGILSTWEKRARFKCRTWKPPRTPSRSAKRRSAKHRPHGVLEGLMASEHHIRMTGFRQLWGLSVPWGLAGRRRNSRRCAGLLDFPTWALEGVGPAGWREFPTGSLPVPSGASWWKPCLCQLPSLQWARHSHCCRHQRALEVT
jgi:hypothetical protein